MFKSAHDKSDSKMGENQKEGWFNFWPGRVAASWICSGDKHLFPIFCSKNAWGNRKAGSVPESLTPLSTGEKCHLKNPISTPPGTCATIRYESLLQFETIPLCPLKDAIPLLLLFLLKCLSSTKNHILNVIISQKCLGGIRDEKAIYLLLYQIVIVLYRCMRIVSVISKIFNYK